ncbi:toxin, partial [Pseudomonas syringae pv. tagetis]
MTDFKRRLQENIAPGLAINIMLAGSVSGDEEIARLVADVDQLNRRINQKLAEYEEYYEYKRIGFWWGQVVG